MNNPELREKVEKILAEVLMKHHDDISKQDDDAIAEAADQIFALLTPMMSEEEISKIIQETKYVGMVRHFNVCKDWADVIASALSGKVIKPRKDEIKGKLNKGFTNLFGGSK